MKLDFVLLVLAIIFDAIKGETTVAVVEYYPVQNTSLSALERLNANAANYVEILRSSGNAPLDIVVFPEMTLNIGNKIDEINSTAVEVFDDARNPCDAKDRYHEYITKISCAARELKTYIVINTVEKSRCDDKDAAAQKSSNCKAFNYFFFNTDLVFDRDGKIIAVYRKVHLFGEAELDPNSEPGFVTFETDFDEDFGIFTCFDILFEYPAHGLVMNGTNTFIYPTMWYSELPFLTSLQAQQMWSQAHNVTLLASGANNPLVGSGGTGIYLGAQGPVVNEIIANSGSKLYTYNLSKDSKPFNEELEGKSIDELSAEMDSFSLLIDNSIYNFTSLVLNLTKVEYSDSLKLCHNDKFCCNLNLTTSYDASKVQNGQNVYTYQFVAYQGIRTFQTVYTGGIEACGLVACLNNSVESCGQRFPKYGDIAWPVTFEKIEISADFDDTADRMQYPNSVLSSIRPLAANLTEWRADKSRTGVVTRSFVLKEAQDRILTFAIYGRNFAWDGLSQPDAAFQVKFSILLLAIVTVLVHLLK